MGVQIPYTAPNIIWGFSSEVRAAALQAAGPGFDSLKLHQSIMEVVKHQEHSVRKHVQPGLLDYDLIDKYINAHGRPRCFCCNEMLKEFMITKMHLFLRIYCVNCCLTTRAVGQCNHVGH